MIFKLVHSVPPPPNRHALPRTTLRKLKNLWDDCQNCRSCALGPEARLHSRFDFGQSYHASLPKLSPYVMDAKNAVRLHVCGHYLHGNFCRINVFSSLKNASSSWKSRYTLAKRT